MLELELITSFHWKDIRRQTFCLDKIQWLSDNSGRGDAEIPVESFSDLELFFHAALYNVPM